MKAPSATDSSNTADPSRTATAYHEAGHAVVAYVLGRLVHKVTVEPGKSEFGASRLGVCRLGKGRHKASQDQLEDEVIILFAGMAAEARFTGRYCQAGASEDLQRIGSLLGQRATNEKQYEKLHRRMFDKTEHLLDHNDHMQAIHWIANELLERTTISGRSVKHFVEQAIDRKK